MTSLVQQNLLHFGNSLASVSRHIDFKMTNKVDDESPLFSDSPITTILTDEQKAAAETKIPQVESALKEAAATRTQLEADVKQAQAETKIPQVQSALKEAPTEDYPVFNPGEVLGVESRGVASLQQVSPHEEAAVEDSPVFTPVEASGLDTNDDAPAEALGCDLEEDAPVEGGAMMPKPRRMSVFNVVQSSPTRSSSRCQGQDNNDGHQQQEGAVVSRPGQDGVNDKRAAKKERRAWSHGEIVLREKLEKCAEEARKLIKKEEEDKEEEPGPAHKWQKIS